MVGRGIQSQLAWENPLGKQLRSKHRQCLYIVKIFPGRNIDLEYQIPVGNGGKGNPVPVGLGQPVGKAAASTSRGKTPAGIGAAAVSAAKALVRTTKLNCIFTNVIHVLFPSSQSVK
jgi:hypothetical protein